jgi:replicative DNA helicase
MPGEMLVVIAESGGGKSTWMVNKSEHSFSEENKNIVYFSLEMGRRQLELRYDTRIAARMFPQLDLTYRKIRDGYMNKDEVSAYKQVIEFQREKKNHIYIVDDPTLSVDSMRDKIDRLKGEISVDEVIVDYLGLISGIEKGWEAVGRVTADLYTLARETNVPIITAGQRNNEGGVGLSYLIKAHSSIMVRINQPEELRLINEMEQEFVKNREGSTPKFTCMVNFDKMLIEDVVPVSIDE